MSTISKLRHILSKRDKIYFVVLVVLSVLLAVIETIGISSIMPFISIATDFHRIQTNRYLHLLYTHLHFSSPEHFVIAFGVALIFFYFFRAFFNLSYYYLLARFSRGRYYLIAYKLLQNYLNFSYSDFTKHDTSTLTKNIINEANNVVALLTNALFMLSEISVSVFLYALLISVNWKMTLLLTVFLAANALFLVKAVGGKLKKEGERRVEFQKRMFESIEISFGNFKIIKLLTNDEPILERFKEATAGFTRTQIINQTLIQFPRLFLETLGFSIVAFIVIYLVWKYGKNITPVLGMLSMYVLALYRLLPSMNRVIGSYNQMLFFKKSLDIVHGDLLYRIEMLGDDNVDFKRNIRLDHVWFGYDSKVILKDVNIEIKKKQKVAVTGESGAGKTTLVDIIIGIYRPSKGRVLVDDVPLSERNIKSWRSKIGYIPQQVYLFPGSVAENIVFGRKMDEARVIECLKMVGMWEFFEEKQGIHTRIGTGGVGLSGGQMQRVAIARAIYSDPEVLVLDEATSALDYEGEQKIMDMIFEIGREKTIIIVAHRRSALKRCERILLVENGEVSEIKNNYVTDESLP